MTYLVNAQRITLNSEFVVSVQLPTLRIEASDNSDAEAQFVAIVGEGGDLQISSVEV
jgi:hypothetical protein